MRDYGETSRALKRYKKDLLKLGLRKCGKTKVFLTEVSRNFFLIAFKF